MGARVPARMRAYVNVFERALVCSFTYELYANACKCTDTCATVRRVCEFACANARVCDIVCGECGFAFVRMRRRL